MKRDDMIREFRKHLHPVTDHAFLTVLEYYESAMSQLDAIANVVNSQTVVVDTTLTALEDSVPAVPDEDLRDRIQDIL